MQGWISLHRQIQESAIYKDSQAVHLWVHLLLKANHKDKEVIFNGEPVTIKAGQLLTGRKVLSAETGISESKIQRLLKLFQKCHMIEQQTNSKNRLISIVKYHLYQQGEQQLNNKRTATEQQLNTNNNVNNENNVNNTDIGQAKPDPVPYQAIVDLYHERLPTLPRVMTLNNKRKSQIRARWKGGHLPSLDVWGDYFDYCKKSRFLMGLTEPSGGRKQFIANLEWITNETNFTNIWEGKYHE